MGGQHPPPTKKAFRPLQASTTHVGADSISAREGLRLPHTTMGPLGSTRPLQRKPSGSLQASTLTRRGGFHIRPGRLAAAAHNHGWAAPAPTKKAPAPGRCRHRPHVGADSISAREGLRLPHTTMGGQHPLQRKPSGLQASTLTRRGGFHIRPGRQHQPWVGSTRPLRKSLPGRCRHRPSHVGRIPYPPGKACGCRTQPWVGSTRPLQRKPSGSLQASTLTRRGGFHIRPGRLAAAAHNQGWAAPAP